MGDLSNGKSNKAYDLFETTDIDNAITLTGYGKFHAALIVSAAISVIGVGFQNGLSSYVFPAAHCELNLTSVHIGNLNVSFLIGGALSSFFWGLLTDSWGRRKVLISSHLLNGGISIICALLPSYTILLVCRFVNGFLIGAPGSILFNYLSEFQPPKYKSASVCYCGLFFTVAWLLLPVTAYFVLPIEVDFNAGFLVLTPWRLFFIILALPEILVGIFYIYLPESPRYLHSIGDTRQTLMVLRRMYEWNTGRDGEKFPVRNLLSDRSSSSKTDCEESILDKIRQLFYAPLVYLTMLTCSIMFSNMFGVFGLGLWLPELFIRFQKFQTLHPNESVSVKQLSTLNFTDTDVDSCTPSFDSSVIMSTIAMAAASILYNGISGFLSSRTKLKTIPLVSMLLGGLSSGSIYWLSSSTQNLLVACIFQASMVTANMTIGSVVVSLFPTQVGGLAICLVMFAGRIGAMCSNVIFGYFMDTSCEIPIFVVAVVVLLGVIMCSLIPSNSNNKNSQNDDYNIANHIEISVISRNGD